MSKVLYDRPTSRWAVKVDTHLGARWLPVEMHAVGETFGPKEDVEFVADCDLGIFGFELWPPDDGVISGAFAFTQSFSRMLEGELWRWPKVGRPCPCCHGKGVA
jgi:hypothetical protein